MSAGVFLDVASDFNRDDNGACIGPVCAGDGTEAVGEVPQGCPGPNFGL